MQFVNVCLTLVGKVPAVRHARLPEAAGEPEPITTARTWFHGRAHDGAPCYDRDALRAGHRLAGQAVVAHQDSTIVIPPGWTAVCDPYGNLVLTAEATAAGANP